MRGVFVDANDSLAEIFERQRKAGDPDVKVHLDPDIKAEDWPKILGGAEIGIVDHTALPTDVAKAGLLALSGKPSTPSGRPMRACGETIMRARSGSPASCEAPPVRMSCRPTCAD